MLTRLLLLATGVLIASVPAGAQTELTGSYMPLMHEDYIERGPGSFLGDYTGMPLTDEGRAKALLYTSNVPSLHERQCLAQSAGVFQYRPVAIRLFWDVHTRANGERYLVITSVVEDPVYLQSPWIIALHFRHEADGSKWSPSACDARF